MTEEENRTQNPASGAPDLGKFKDVEALARAYRELEAEFTRRSQRLKALEEASRNDGAQARTEVPAEGISATTDEIPAQDSVLADDTALYAAVSKNDAVRRRIVGEYLGSLRGVPLMAGGGTPVRAPSRKVSSIGEAGALALGYLRNHKQ